MYKSLFMIVIVLVATVLIASCGVRPSDLQPPLASGAVEPVQIRTTLAIIRDAVNGLPSTVRLTNGQGWLFARPLGDGWSWVAVDAQGQRTMTGHLIDALRARGNAAAVATFSDFVAFLEAKGWTRVGPAAVPPALVTAANATQGWLVALANHAPAILVFPSGWFELGPLDEMLPVQISE